MQLSAKPLMSDSEVLRARARCAAGTPITEVAAEMGYPQRVVHRAVRGITHADLPGPVAWRSRAGQKRRVCTVDGCEDRHQARGLCAYHYRLDREKTARQRLLSTSVP